MVPPCRPRIMKFGGTSVADADAIVRLVRIVGSSSAPAVVVVSAMSGVTDALLALAAAAERRDRDAVQKRTRCVDRAAPGGRRGAR